MDPITTKEVSPDSNGDIINKITFENVHEIAYLLHIGKPIVASALLEELLYLKEKSII